MKVVGFEARRDKLGIYFEIPGWPTRIKQGLGVPYTKEARKRYEHDLGATVTGWILGGQWKELLDRFPDNQQLRAALSTKLGGTQLTIDKMLDGLVEYWERKGNRAVRKMQSKLTHLREFFSATYVSEVTDLRIDQFISHMLKRGYSGAQVNRCLAHLKTAYRKVGKRHGIERVPVMDRQAEAPAREDFYERHEIDRLVAELPEHEQVATMVGFFTGWRLDAVLSRRKTDFDGEFLHLDESHSKNRQPMLFPVDGFPELRALLERQLAYVRELELRLGRIIPWLFPNPHTGDRLKTFYASWRAAVVKAGLNIDPATQKQRVHSVTGKPVARLYHGLRRTATRNLEQLGLSALETMDLVGHKTLAMHQRYRGLADQKKVREYGSKIAAAVAVSGQSKVISVQRASNKAPLGSEEGVLQVRSTPEKSVVNQGLEGAGGGTRTRTDLSVQRILSPRS